jgi:SCO1/SenC
LQPLFVTVDPERDNGPILRSFTASFDKRLIGLGGAPEQINAAASALGVRYEKVLLSESDYVVDHSSSFSLVDPTGRHATTFQVSEPHQIAAKLVDILYRAEVNLDKVRISAPFDKSGTCAILALPPRASRARVNYLFYSRLPADPTSNGNRFAILKKILGCWWGGSNAARFYLGMFAVSRAGPVNSRICMPVFARSTM